MSGGYPQSRIVATTASAVTLLVAHLVLILRRRVDLHVWGRVQSPLILDRQAMNSTIHLFSFKLVPFPYYMEQGRDQANPLDVLATYPNKHLWTVEDRNYDKYT